MINISFLVPVFNREKKIQNLFDSIDRVFLENDEIVLVDDGSNDNSLNVLSKYSTTHKNVVVLSQENQGTLKSRLKLIEHASKEFVFFVDSDDEIVPDTINVARKYLTLNSNCSGVIMDMKFHYINNTFFVVKSGLPLSNWRELDVSSGAYLESLVSQGGIYGTLCNKILKRELFDVDAIRIATNNKRMMYEEDQLMCFFAFAKEQKIFHYLPLCGYVYFQDNNSTIHNQIFPNCVTDRLLIYEAYKKHLIERYYETDILYSCFKRYLEFVSKENLLAKKYFEYKANKKAIKSSILYHDLRDLFKEEIKKESWKTRFLAKSIYLGFYWPIVPFFRKFYRG